MSKQHKIVTVESSTASSEHDELASSSPKAAQTLNKSSKRQRSDSSDSDAKAAARSKPKKQVVKEHKKASDKSTPWTKTAEIVAKKAKAPNESSASDATDAKKKKKAKDSDDGSESDTKASKSKGKKVVKKAKVAAAADDSDEEGSGSDKTGVKHFDDDFDVLAPAAIGKLLGKPPPKPKKKKRTGDPIGLPAKSTSKGKKTADKGKPKAYMPRKASAPFAVLIGLYLAAKDDPDEYESCAIVSADLCPLANAHLDKKDLSKGQNLNEATKPLVEARMIVKEGRGQTAAYSLTPVGMSYAMAAAESQDGVETYTVPNVKAYVEGCSQDSDDGDDESDNKAAPKGKKAKK